MRELLPPRRASWTQKVRIENSTFYLSFGEYPDGRLGEVWIEAHRENTFTRGVLGALARVVSIALQHGVPVDDVVEALRPLNYPPNGEVKGSSTVVGCKSVTNWIAQEISAAYGSLEHTTQEEPYEDELQTEQGGVH